MITYAGGAFGFEVLLRLHGSAIFKSLTLAVLSCGVYLILYFLTGITEVPSDPSEQLLFEHPYPIGALVSAFSFLLVFRANFAYSRYWEAFTSIHLMHSKWLDFATEVAAFHYQSERYQQFAPPAFGTYGQMLGEEPIVRSWSDPDLTSPTVGPPPTVVSAFSTALMTVSRERTRTEDPMTKAELAHHLEEMADQATIMGDSSVKSSKLRNRWFRRRRRTKEDEDPRASIPKHASERMKIANQRNQSKNINHIDDDDLKGNKRSNSGGLGGSGLLKSGKKSSRQPTLYNTNTTGLNFTATARMTWREGMKAIAPTIPPRRKMTYEGNHEMPNNSSRPNTINSNSEEDPHQKLRETIAALEFATAEDNDKTIPRNNQTGTGGPGGLSDLFGGPPPPAAAALENATAEDNDKTIPRNNQTGTGGPSSLSDLFGGPPPPASATLENATAKDNDKTIPRSNQNGTRDLGRLSDLFDPPPAVGLDLENATAEDNDETIPRSNQNGTRDLGRLSDLFDPPPAGLDLENATAEDNDKTIPRSNQNGTRDLGRLSDLFDPPAPPPPVPGRQPSLSRSSTEGSNYRVTMEDYWQVSANNSYEKRPAKTPTPPNALFLEEIAHLLSLLSAVAMSTLRNDLEDAESPLIEFFPNEPWPHVDPDDYLADVRREWESASSLPNGWNFGLPSSVRYMLGLSRNDVSRTLYNAARPFRVIGNVSDAEIEMLQMARGPFAKVSLCSLWLQEFLSREHLHGSTGKIGPPIISRLYQYVSEGMAGYNQARKIAYIPFPFPHAQITTLFIFVIVGFMPLLMLTFIHHLTLGLILNLFTVLCFVGLHEVARELENPFQNVPNDLPLNNYQAQFNESLMIMFYGYHPDGHNWLPPVDDDDDNAELDNSDENKDGDSNRRIELDMGAMLPTSAPMARQSRHHKKPTPFNIPEIVVEEEFGNQSVLSWDDPIQML